MDGCLAEYIRNAGAAHTKVSQVARAVSERSAESSVAEVGARCGA